MMKWILVFLVLTNMGYARLSANERLNPQDDFYYYANENWIKTHPRPASEAEWSVFNQLKQEIDLDLKRTLSNLNTQTKLSQNSLFHQLYLFYHSGLDNQTIEKAGLKPIQPLISMIQSYKNQQDLAKILAKLHLHDIPAFFEVYPYPHLHKSKFMITGINQPSLILPDRSYYVHQDNMIQAYQDFLNKIFYQLGYSKEKQTLAVQHVLSIETQLAKFSANRDFFRQPKHIDHLLTLDKLHHEFPELQFKTYFSSLQPNAREINLTNPEYFEKLNQWLPHLSQEAIKDYLLAILVVDLAQYLPSNYSEPACQFLKTIRGNQACPQPWERILETLNQTLGFALGELYVATRPKDNTIPYVTEIYENIRKSLRQKIIDNLWLSTKTKNKALLKLEKMQSRIGYPKPLDYRDLKLKSRVYLDNVLAARYFETKRQLAKIEKPIDPHEWDMPPQSINAYYSVSQNQINIPLGILQSPFFNPKAAGAANYGGIGVVIGHEMFHGFDDEGSQFDENGQLDAWWSAKEWQKYQTQVRCIQTQFSSYPIPSTKLKVNGKLVSGEAIADLGGINLALEAYRQSQQFKEDKTVNKLSPIQQFYLSFARIWASNITPAEAKRKGLTDPHPPKMLRVKGTLRNCPEFYQAFQLPEPESYCRLF